MAIEEHVVSGVEEVRRIVKASELDDDLSFFVGSEAPLLKAHQMWELLRVEIGGHAVLSNPDVLVHKEAALEFVKRKVDQLRRWVAHTDRKLLSVNQKLEQLQQLLEAGGPGPRREYTAHGYKGIIPFIDVDKEMDEEDLEEHISDLTSLILQESPGSPAPGGSYSYRSVDQCNDRERKEQLDVVRFNHAYLNVKKEGLQMLSAHLVQAIAALEEEFFTKPTFLGAGDGDFVRFEEVKVFPGEIRRA